MVILITGTSRGIGKNLAQYYLQKGHKVIGCSRKESTIEDESYEHYCLDVCDESRVGEIARIVRNKYKVLDVLINNAGVAAMNHFMLTPEETARNIMNINYFGTYTCIRAFVNLLRKSNHPRIINFSTVAVPYNLEGEMAYVSSKAAVESMTKILAKELSSFKITVNAVGPTPILTDLISKVPKEKIDGLLEKQAIKRFGEFEDIQNVIDFYMDEKSDFITGQIIYLGGVNR